MDTREKFSLNLIFFIGEVQDIKVEEIKDIIKTNLSPFVFKAGGGGYFPNIKRPRVIWAGCEKGGRKLVELFQDISTCLSSVGIVGDSKPFRPHLTLGRIKYAHSRDNWVELIKYLNDLSWPETKIDRFILWKSTLKPTGPIYTPLKEFYLK